MKQTKDIIQQMEKEFDDRFKFAGTYAMGELQADNIKSFIHSYTKSLLSAFAIKVIGHDKSIPEHMKDYVFHSIACEIRAENRLKAKQRLKVKEIIKSLQK